MVIDAQQQTERVDEDVKFATENLRARVIAGRIKRAPPLEGTLRNDPGCGTASMSGGLVDRLPWQPTRASIAIADVRARRTTKEETRSMTIPGMERHRDKGGELSRKHGNTLVSTLRKIYGDSFAHGFSSHTKLSQVLHELDNHSLTQLAHDDEAGQLGKKVKAEEKSANTAANENSGSVGAIGDVTTD